MSLLIRYCEVASSPPARTKDGQGQTRQTKMSLSQLQITTTQLTIDQSERPKQGDSSTKTSRLDFDTATRIPKGPRLSNDYSQDSNMPRQTRSSISMNKIPPNSIAFPEESISTAVGPQSLPPSITELRDGSLASSFPTGEIESSHRGVAGINSILPPFMVATNVLLSQERVPRDLLPLESIRETSDIYDALLEVWSKAHPEATGGGEEEGELRDYFARAFRNDVESEATRLLGNSLATEANYVNAVLEVLTSVHRGTKSAFSPETIASTSTHEAGSRGRKTRRPTARDQKGASMKAKSTTKEGKADLSTMLIPLVDFDNLSLALATGKQDLLKKCGYEALLDAQDLDVKTQIQEWQTRSLRAAKSTRSDHSSSHVPRMIQALGDPEHKASPFLVGVRIRGTEGRGYELEKYFDRGSSALSPKTCSWVNCGKTFVKKFELDMHLKEQHVTCGLCQEVVLDKELRQHYHNVHQDSYGGGIPCKYAPACPMTFRLEADCRKHEAWDHTPCQEDGCNFLGTTKTMREHRKVEHSGSRRGVDESKAGLAVTGHRGVVGSESMVHEGQLLTEGTCASDPATSKLPNRFEDDVHHQEESLDVQTSEGYREPKRARRESPDVGLEARLRETLMMELYGAVPTADGHKEGGNEVEEDMLAPGKARDMGFFKEAFGVTQGAVEDPGDLF